MTATVDTSQAPEVETVLKRVNQRLSKDAGEQVLDAYGIEQLAEAVRYQIVGPMIPVGGDDQAARLQEVSAQVEQLRVDLDDKRAELGVKQEVVDSLRSDVQRMREELRTVTEQRDEVVQESARMADAVAAAQAAQPHRCAYPLDGPDQLPGPCGCGKPFPQPWRRQGHPTQPPTEPDAWTALFDQIRQEVGQR